MKKNLIVLSLSVLMLSGCASVAPVVSNGGTTPIRNAVSQVKEIDDLQTVADYARTAPARTLFVFDIDDTLLTAEQFFGSDYWYEWQKQKDLPSSEAVKCKFDYIALNYEAQSMKPTQIDAAEVFNAITAPKMLQTSRGANYRGGTERELARNGFKLPTALDNQSVGRIWDWTSADGSRNAPVSYHHGLMMVTGQDKGVMLEFLLAQTAKGGAFDRVVLIDDGIANIENMQRAMRTANRDYMGFHYTRISKPLPINPELAKQADDDYEQSRKYLKDVFPTRYEQLEKGDCAY